MKSSTLLIQHVLLIIFVELSSGKDKCSSQQQCQSELVSRDETLNYLSSKKPYIFNDSISYQYSPPGCNAKKFWYFGRHGTRYSSERHIIQMQTILPQIQEEILKGHKNCQGTMCKKELKRIKSWKLNKDLHVSTASYLSKQGERELHNIARRYKTRFPDIFSSHFDNTTYYFRFTKSERTERSAKAFVQGLFGTKEATTVWFPKPEKADPVLKFYDACPKWKKEVDKNPEANKEHDKFIISSVMNSTITRVSQRLGISRELTLDEITIMYTTCGFETAWENGKLSVWCAPFDLDSLQVMAYREDLDYYWLDGYGHETNYKQACPLVADVVKYFQATADGNNSTTGKPNDTNDRKVQGYFAHSGGTLKMLARLGLFNDSIPLRSDNFQDVKDNYKWRTSEIDTMATNMAFVLYECPVEVSEKYLVGLFFQEKPVLVQSSESQMYLPYQDFRSLMGPIVDNCDINQICT